ncbi:MAG: 5-formyltetrahydrofolate cyclo-ligase [Gammaproteobacteria bacterium]|nr:5-formyltetrahydrofolate cyclo-ligase [Gammaproteobacteria bacterium]
MNTLRATALRARRKMHADERHDASQKICRRVTRSTIFFASNAIGCYLPRFDEVDTLPIIERAWCANKRIFVPVLRTRHKMLFREMRPETILEKNDFDVWEPTSGKFLSPRKLDIVIAPTVAFDDDNNRIGMGGGYFDRCFAYLRHRKFWLRPKLVGVAFNCQKVEKISPNPWDIRLYKVFTEVDAV